MSNTGRVPDGAERDAISAELQLILAEAKTDGCRDLEQQAWELNARLQTDATLRTAKFAELRRRAAEAEEMLCRLNLAASS